MVAGVFPRGPILYTAQYNVLQFVAFSLRCVLRGYFFFCQIMETMRAKVREAGAFILEKGAVNNAHSAR